MRLTAICSPVALAVAVLAGPAAAQTADWNFEVTPYAWLPGMNTSLDTRFGTLNSNGSTSDVLSALDMAFMGTIDANRGRWSLIGDIIYTDLSNEKDTPFGTLFSDVSVETKVAALTGYVGYRVAEGDQFTIDVLGGFRAFEAKVSTSLGSGDLPGRGDSVEKSWVDPLVGVRGRYDFNDKWNVMAAFDAGGTDSNSDFTWQAVGTVGYTFNDRWSARGGWRYLEIKNVIDNRDVEIQLSGPAIGVAYRF